MGEPLSRADTLTALALEGGEALSAREVAARTGLSERQVVRCRHRLAELGVLELLEPGAGRRGTRDRTARSMAAACNGTVGDCGMDDETSE